MFTSTVDHKVMKTLGEHSVSMLSGWEFHNRSSNNPKSTELEARSLQFTVRSRRKKSFLFKSKKIPEKLTIVLHFFGDRSI